MARGSKQEIAAEQLRSAAEAGDPAAMWQYALAVLRQPPPPPLSPGQNALSYLVRVTKAVRSSGDAEARDLIARSATAGYPPALVVEAELAEQSDPDRTESLLRSAADLGDTAAMLYLAGLLALHDRAEAAQWFTRLAERGDKGRHSGIGPVLLDESRDFAEESLQSAAAVLRQLAPDKIERLNAVSALVKHGDARIANELFHAIFGDVAVTAKNLLRRNGIGKTLIREHAFDHGR